MKSYPAILNAFYNKPHLLAASKFLEIDAFLRRRLAGDQTANDYKPERQEPVVRLLEVGGRTIELTAEQLAAEQLPASSSPSQEFVAVLPLFGTIMQHASFESEYSGGCSTEMWQRQFRKLDLNAAVKTIVVECHTPGGQVIGTEETADVVRAARETGRTRIVSVANSMMASAGLWIGTAAKEVYVTPGGEIGSLGVVSMHQDISKWEETVGLKTTLIATSPLKILGNQYEPLGEDARAQLEADNEEVLGRFVKAMAANRGATPAKVKSDFGNGAMLWAKEAVKAGLADGVATLQEVLDREVGKLNKSSAKKSMRNAVAIAQAQLD